MTPAFLSFFRTKKQPGAFFTWAYAILGSVFVFGVYVDGWAHNNIVETIETFFTPWHAIMYGGYALIALFLFFYAVRGYKNTGSWKRALPLGYGASLLGVFVFGASGFGDFLWHSVFGIEDGIDALLSPTHLGLAIGGFLMAGASLRVWLVSDKLPKPEFVRQLPMLLSAAFTLSVVTFMTQYASYTEVRASGSIPDSGFERDLVQALGISGFQLEILFLMALVFILLRRGPVAFGGFTTIFGINGALMMFMKMEPRLILVPLASGLLADLLFHAPESKHFDVGQFRLASFLVPMFFHFAYFAILMGTGGVWWSVHLWTGSILITGLVGWLLSFVAVPPTVAK